MFGPRPCGLACCMLGGATPTSVSRRIWVRRGGFIMVMWSQASLPRKLGGQPRPLRPSSLGETGWTIAWWSGLAQLLSWWRFVVLSPVTEETRWATPDLGDPVHWVRRGGLIVARCSPKPCYRSNSVGNPVLRDPVHWVRRGGLVVARCGPKPCYRGNSVGNPDLRDPVYWVRRGGLVTVRCSPKPCYRGNSVGNPVLRDPVHWVRRGGLMVALCGPTPGYRGNSVGNPVLRNPVDWVRRGGPVLCGLGRRVTQFTAWATPPGKQYM